MRLRRTLALMGIALNIALAIGCKPAAAKDVIKPLPPPIMPGDAVLVTRENLPNGVTIETWVLGTGVECVLTYSELGSMNAAIAVDCDFRGKPIKVR